MKFIAQQLTWGISNPKIFSQPCETIETTFNNASVVVVNAAVVCLILRPVLKTNSDLELTKPDLSWVVVSLSTQMS
jgi:hypothetical protein